MRDKGTSALLGLFDVPLVRLQSPASYLYLYHLFDENDTLRNV